ncbi:unnamed protein product [Umbelopsis vinacea]
MLRRALTARISAPFRSARVLYSKPATVTALNQVRRGITTYSTVSNPATAKALTAGILASVSLSFLYAAKLNALEHEVKGDQVCQAIIDNDMKLLKKQVARLAEDPNFTPNCYHRYGWTPLQTAVIQDNVPMAKFLLELGADPNLEDHYYPRSHQEANVRQEDFSSELLPYRDYRKFTALHYACIIQNPDMVGLLLDHMADPTARTAQGLTPREYLYYVERFTGEKNLKIESALRAKEASYPVDKAAHDEEMRKAQKKKEKEYRLKHPIEEALKARIVGQLGPIHAVASAIRRKQNGWHDEDHPLVFLFCGSSGVGKTELVKALATHLHGKNIDKGFIRIDMSEFQHKHDVSRFIGSPPGYVGFEEGGQLTEKLKDCPNAIVLLDEVEKAHPDVLTIMLQLFDEGRITDGKGTTVECKDAIFVMTSNLAQHQIADEAELLRLEAKTDHDSQSTGINSEDAKQTHLASGDAPTDTKKDSDITLSRRFIDLVIYPILYDHFGRDEFLGRINEVLFFLPFDQKELKEITSRELMRWAEKAKKRHNITLTWSPDVVDVLVEGYNIRYGARSIKYEVERKVVNHVAKLNENDEVTEGGRVHVSVEQVDSGRRIVVSVPEAGGDKKSSGWFGKR